MRKVTSGLRYFISWMFDWPRFTPPCLVQLNWLLVQSPHGLLRFFYGSLKIGIIHWTRFVNGERMVYDLQTFCFSGSGNHWSERL